MLRTEAQLLITCTRSHGQIMPMRKGAVASLQKVERKSAMTIVLLLHFIAPVISGLCKHSGQPKDSITQRDQRLEQFTAFNMFCTWLHSCCSSCGSIPTPQSLAVSKHGFCIKVIYQNKKSNNNNLKKLIDMKIVVLFIYLHIIRLALVECD